MVLGNACSTMAVTEWYLMYRDQLLEDWKLAEKHQPLKKIPPLE